MDTLGVVAETKFCLRIDKRTDGRTDEQTHYYRPLRLTSGDQKEEKKTVMITYVNKQTCQNIFKYVIFRLRRILP